MNIRLIYDYSLESIFLCCFEAAFIVLKPLNYWWWSVANPRSTNFCENFPSYYSPVLLAYFVKRHFEQMRNNLVVGLDVCLEHPFTLAVTFLLATISKFECWYCAYWFMLCPLNLASVDIHSSCAPVFPNNQQGYVWYGLKWWKVIHFTSLCLVWFFREGRIPRRITFNCQKGLNVNFASLFWTFY